MLGASRVCLAGAACEFDSKHEGDISVLQIGLLLSLQHCKVIMMLVIQDRRYAAGLGQAVCGWKNIIHWLLFFLFWICACCQGVGYVIGF